MTLPILPLVYFLGRYLPELRGRPLAMVYTFWEPFVAWGTILFLTRYFQRRFYRLDGVWQPLSRRAYTIYIIHPPVLVAVALAWRNVAAAPFLKFAITGSLACALCYLIAGFLLRWPKLASIL
ncbi:acyltransferase 3 [Burkholderia sp. H160]|nr:acyltransferase 3 [Burkholderia sp. H160]